jgi:hypothetical protein
MGGAIDCRALVPFHQDLRLARLPIASPDTVKLITSAETLEPPKP